MYLKGASTAPAAVRTSHMSSNLLLLLQHRLLHVLPEHVRLALAAPADVESQSTHATQKMRFTAKRGGTKYDPRLDANGAHLEHDETGLSARVRFSR